MINSPRSLRACKELGILPNELYQITIEEYRSQNPTSFTLDQKMLQLRYDGYEKFRNDSITLVKKRREVLINKEIEENNSTKRTKSENNFVARSLERMKEGERKAMENLKNQQKKNIRNIIEQQINQEILKKIELRRNGDNKKEKKN